MADKALTLEMSALDRAPLRIDVSEVAIPGTEGIFTVMPGHAPLLATVEVGVLNARFLDGSEHLFAVNGGFCQVLDDHVLLLADTVEMGEEIDVSRAEAARKRAEERIAKPDGIDLLRAEAALKRAVARIQASAQPAQRQ